VIRSAFVGLWVCAVTIGAGYAGSKWEWGEANSQKDSKKFHGKLTQVKVKPLSIPVTTGGKVSGYVLAQFTFTASAETLKQLSVKPEVFLLDAAFNGLYAGRELDIAKLNKENWIGLTNTVKAAVNARFGAEIIHDVVLEEFGYVPLGQVRGGQSKGEPAPNASKHGKGNPSH
jgi:hypothetical protein